VIGMPYERPPSQYADAVDIGGDVYIGVNPNEPEGSLAGILVWHWCPPGDTYPEGRWRAAGVGDHQLVSRDPLTLSPSLLWPCCNKHGYIKSGRWEAC